MSKVLDAYNAKLQRMIAAPSGSDLKKKLQAELVVEAAGLAEAITGQKQEPKTKLPLSGSRKTGLTFGKATAALAKK